MKNLGKNNVYNKNNILEILVDIKSPDVIPQFVMSFQLAFEFFRFAGRSLH